MHVGCYHRLSRVYECFFFFDEINYLLINLHHHHFFANPISLLCPWERNFSHQEQRRNRTCRFQLTAGRRIHYVANTRYIVDEKSTSGETVNPIGAMQHKDYFKRVSCLNFAEYKQFFTISRRQKLPCPMYFPQTSWRKPRSSNGVTVLFSEQEIKRD